MDEQKDMDWLNEELKSQGTPLPYEKRTALKLAPNKVVEMEIDFSKPFYKYEDKIHKSWKAVIPITVGQDKMYWWVNIKNPIYRTLCERGKAGIKTVKVIQTGYQADTRYSLVE